MVAAYRAPLDNFLLEEFTHKYWNVHPSIPKAALDIGTDGASFVTTNAEDHLSGSLNYSTGSGSVAETVNFSSDGIVGTGFTTVIMQGHTFF